MSAGAAVFDLDGVIVKTNLVKHAAMLSLFADHPEQQAAISARTVVLLVGKNSPIYVNTTFVQNQRRRC